MADADAIVVGAGLAGLVAATELTGAGRRVVVVEQESRTNLGGQAFWSFGGLFFVDSPEQRRMGIKDSQELAWQDWLGTAGFDRPVAAALGPADVRHHPNPLIMQPGPFLAGGEVDVGLRPAARPLILGAVEPGGSEPVLPGQLARVVNPKPPLLGTVDQEQSAQGPERLPPEGGLGLLVEDDHLAARIRQLGSRDQARQPGPDDDCVSVCGHRASIWPR